MFVSDASAEAERASQALRAEGYVVVDVPLSMLVARVAVQHPRVIVIDVDADGAVETVARVRELPDADDVEVLFVGRGGAGAGGAAYALAHEASGFFERPIDLEALARKVDALTGGARPVPRRPTTPPPSLSSSRPPAGMLPPPSMRAGSEGQRSPFATPRPPPHVSTPPVDVGPVSMRRAGALQAPLSHELEVLLQDAEQRIGVQLPHDSVVPSPEEEIEAVLPAELLAVLDEPIDDDDDDDFAAEPAPPPTRGAQMSAAGAGASLADAREGSMAIPTPRGTSPSPPAVGTGVPAAPKTHGGGDRGTHAGTQSEARWRCRPAADAGSRRAAWSTATSAPRRRTASSRRFRCRRRRQRPLPRAGPRRRPPRWAPRRIAVGAGVTRRRFRRCSGSATRRAFLHVRSLGARAASWQSRRAAREPACVAPCSARGTW